MPANLEGRIMVLEQIVNEEIPLIKDYMKKGFELRLDATKQLANIQSAIIEGQSYQQRCDNDRAKLDTRVDAVERKQVWGQGAAAAIAFVVSGIAWALEYFKKG